MAQLSVKGLRRASGQFLLVAHLLKSGRSRPARKLGAISPNCDSRAFWYSAPMQFLPQSDAEAFFRHLGFGPKGPVAGSRTATRFRSDDLFYKSRLETAREVSQLLAHAQGDFTECVVWACDLVWGDKTRDEDPPLDWKNYKRWREQHGETRSLYQTPGHVFGSTEHAELVRLLELAIHMGWDTLIGARPSKVLIELSHNDRITIHARSRQRELISALEHLGVKGQ